MNFLRQLTTAQSSQPPPPAETFKDSSLNQISLEYTYAELKEATRNFDESAKLGSGTYGGVYKGVLQDGTEVAIKVLDVPDEAGFEEEVKVLSKFRHPHLVILMGFARHGTQRLLVYEMLAGGDVHKRLQRSCVEGFPFPWHERVSIALDAACGLSHLHHASPKVYHRDIKSPNILLDKNGTAKMADFGLACQLPALGGETLRERVGTPKYIAPEVLVGQYGASCDLWSCGVVLHLWLAGSSPFPENLSEEQLRRVILDRRIILDGEAWETVSEAARSLVRALLKRDIRERPSAAAVTQHSWLVDGVYRPLLVNVEVKEGDSRCVDTRECLSPVCGGTIPWWGRFSCGALCAPNGKP
mmetsp:Transcript_57335/g.145849  ORF Transcript_57335/g.145849 Transcript_57335/m.145849 type:complete len:357 (+) Transcript_57335:40-1110(+)